MFVQTPGRQTSCVMTKDCWRFKVILNFSKEKALHFKVEDTQLAFELIETFSKNLTNESLPDISSALFKPTELLNGLWTTHLNYFVYF